MATYSQTYSGILLQNGVGIPGVECVLMSLAGTRIATTVTEGTMLAGDNLVDGRYTFSSVAPGQYVIEFYGEGFTPANNITIDIAGTSEDMVINSSENLANILSDFKHNTWASRLLTDVFDDSTQAVRNEGGSIANQALYVDISDNSLRMPDSAALLPSTPYSYYTEEIETDHPADTPDISGMDICTLYASYVLGDYPIKIQSTCDATSVTPDWFTWLDTQAGVNNLGQEKIAGTDFTNGTKFAVRVFMTSSATDPFTTNHSKLYYYSFLTGPDLFDDD